MTIYAMEPGFLGQLLEDRRQILEIAKSLGTAEEMRAARKDLMESLLAINITPKTAAEAAKAYTIDADGAAHIPIIGELTNAAEKDACGAYTADALTEYGFITKAAEAADADDRVSSIVFDVNSPGGYADGVAETSNAIRAISKPTEAHIGSMAASAAYWLASQADKIVANSIASRVGSIGVAAEEYNPDEFYAKQGIAHRVYTSTDAPDKRPDTSTEEGQKKVVALLDDIHTVFIQTVAEGRDTTPENVNKTYGRGSVLIASNALSVGMIDEIQTVSRKTVLDVIEDETGVTGKEPAAEAENEEGDMDIQSLKTEHPDVFAAVENGGIEIGVKKERARASALDEQKAADPDNAKLAAVIDEAKASGKEVADIQTQIAVAVRDGNLDGENPPEVATAKAQTALSEEDLEAAKLAGLTPDEYRAAMKEVD